MTNFIRILAAGAFLAGTAAFPATWTGKISDSMCGANHKKTAEHGTAKMTDRDCTQGCEERRQIRVRLERQSLQRRESGLRRLG